MGTTEDLAALYSIVTDIPKKTVVEMWAQSWNRSMIRFFSRRGVGRAQADDFIQEVYLRLLRMEDLTLVKNPQAYLFKMASNLLSEWRLDPRRLHPHDSRALEMLFEDDDVQHSAELDDEGVIVQHAVEELPSLTRQIVVLHLRDELSYEQIASQLGITRRMVKRHMISGYAKLRDRLAHLRLPKSSRNS